MVRQDDQAPIYAPCEAMVEAKLVMTAVADRLVGFERPRAARVRAEAAEKTGLARPLLDERALHLRASRFLSKRTRDEDGPRGGREGVALQARSSPQCRQSRWRAADENDPDRFLALRELACFSTPRRRIRPRTQSANEVAMGS